MFIKNVSTLTTSLDKNEFIELADLYIRIIKEACKIEKITLPDNSSSLPLKELTNIGVISDANDINLLQNILGIKFNEYISAVNLVEKNNCLYPYVCKLYNSYRKQEQIKFNNCKYTVADFFCGAGGISLGFKQAGFSVKLANDIEDVCTFTYKYNHPEIPSEKVVKGDIKDVIQNLNSIIDGDIDVVIGGPPCQGFSQANKNHRVIDDPRNKLYKYYLKAIERIVPKFVVMENVRGMLKVAQQVIEDYENLVCHKDNKVYKYIVSYKLLNSEHFSVAQSRERLIYIAIRDDISKQLKITPETIFYDIEINCKNNTIFTLQDALDDIDKLDAERQKNRNEIDSNISGKKVTQNKFAYNDNKYLQKINEGRNIPLIYNHKARYCSDLNYEIYRRLDQGDDAINEKIKDIMPYAHRNHCFKDKYYKLIASKPCRTITAHLRMDCHSHIHPYEVRALTPREAARVQSFPDDYVFLGAYLKTYMQVGNAVPPMMAKSIAEVIMNYLKMTYDKDRPIDKENK